LEKRNNAFSFTNYLKKIRPKFETKYSKDYAFINPFNDGKPFVTHKESILGEIKSYDKLRMFLNRHATKTIKDKVGPKYRNYDCRHWCAVARLIRTKIESKHFDVYTVMKHLGHTKIETTMNYIQEAEFCYKKKPVDWIKRVLKFHKNMEGHNTLKTGTGQKPSVQPQNNRSGRSRRLPDSNR
jgi:integrase